MTDGNDMAGGRDRLPRRAWRRITAPLARVFDGIRPRTFRAKLTLAISLVFLIALGSATLVQTLVVNGMFSYAMTITYENGRDGDGIDANGSNDASSSDGDYMSMQGWSANPDPDTWTQSHQGANSPDFLGSVSGGKGEGSASGRIDGNPYRVDWGGDGSFTITTPYGISVWNQDTVANGLRISAAIIFVFFGATSILVIWIVTSRMSKRLQSIGDQTAALDPSDLGTRIDVKRNGDEVTRLGDSINGMLDRIQAASEAERRFVSNASHELRTPIAAVETNLDAPLAQGRFPADVEPSVRRALAANRRGAELVGALLTLSRIQSGAYGKLGDGTAGAPGGRSGAVVGADSASMAGRTDLAACVRDALADMDDEIASRGITVTVDVDDEVDTSDAGASRLNVRGESDGDAAGSAGASTIMVAANPALMRLAVGNLIRNAVMHNTDAGGSIIVTITGGNALPSASAPSRSGGTDGAAPASVPGGVRLTVANTTDERLPDDLTELIQPFHRGVNSRISAVSGVGLGLSIADAACNAMGARLHLSSHREKDRGTVFTAVMDGPSTL